MTGLEGTFKGNFVWIPIAGSCQSLYNEWIIKKGSLSRYPGKENSSIVW
jgi:hypothetical protein